MLNTETLTSMNRKQKNYPLFESFTQRFVDQVNSQPDLKVYTFLAQPAPETLTYSELSNRINNTIALLKQHCRVGDRIILIFNPGFDFIVSFLACLFSGVVAVPLYPAGKNKTKEDTLLHILADCRPHCILTSEDLIETLSDLAIPDSLNLSILAIKDVSQSLNKSQSDYYLPYPEDLAFLQYTSGSTGKPKGVMVTHQNLVANQLQIQKISGHNRHSVGVCWLPPYHDMGLIGGILQPLFVGCHIILMAPSAFITKPLTWLKALSDYQATTACAPNFAFDLCVSRVNQEQAACLDLSRLSVIFNGAEPISITTIDSFSEHFKVSGFNKQAFLPCYGMAESTLIITGRKGIETLKIDNQALKKHRVVQTDDINKSTELVSCGSPVEGLKMAIVDSLTGKSVSDGQINEIWVSGPNVAAGYWNKPELSKEVFAGALKNDSRRWLKTGDLGFIKNKQLYISGRQKELIIIRGKNYYPHDIEALIFQHFPEIRNNGVASFSFIPQNIDANLIHPNEEHLAIVCELERKTFRKVEHLKLCLAINQLITGKLEITPYSIILTKPAALPKTTSGKIRRFECRNRMLDSTLPNVYEWKNSSFYQVSNKITQVSQHIPETINSLKTLEKWVLDYLERHNNDIQPLNTSQRFEDVSMDSLQKANFVCELSEHINFDISVDTLEKYQTVDELSRYLSAFCAVRDGLAQLKDEEKQNVLKMIDENSFQKERFTLEEIPKEFYCFDEYLPNKDLVKRNELIKTMGVNPFFSEVLSINDNYITKNEGNFINFSSNNFLGLSNNVEVQMEAQHQITKLGTSVSASRLISGQKPLHKKLESQIAALINVEEAVVFVGAATANISTIGHLFNKKDLILYDELSHESLSQGAKLSHATARPFRHNDFDDLEALLGKMRGRFEKVLIFIEGLYSMDGDTPELRQFIRIKKQYKAWLMVDECLSIGVLGKSGRGISEEQAIDSSDVDIWMGGLSKAFASCGGYIAGKKSLINYLKYTCPGFIFTTGISPANAAAASKAIDVINRDCSPVADLRKNTQLFLSLARGKNLNTGVCQGYSIVPIIVGDSMHCIEIYRGLLEDGINVQPILYPAVAEGAARFRFSLTALHTEEQIRYTIDCIEKRIKKRSISNNIREAE